jgi:hypothetical protein
MSIEDLQHNPYSVVLSCLVTCCYTSELPQLHDLQQVLLTILIIINSHRCQAMSDEYTKTQCRYCKEGIRSLQTRF